MEIKEKILKYEKFILYANTCNECYFKMAYGDKEWSKVYGIAPGFFGIARKSIQSEVFMTIGKLFERSNRSDHNIHRFLNYIESNASNITIEKTKELVAYVRNSRELIVCENDVIERALGIRDKAYAHLDKVYFNNDNQHKQIDITYEEIVKLIKLAGDIVNDFNRIIYDSNTHMHYSNGDDIDNLMSFCLKNL